MGVIRRQIIQTKSGMVEEENSAEDDNVAVNEAEVKYDQTFDSSEFIV